jgi:hypothetical protein
MVSKMGSLLTMYELGVAGGGCVLEYELYRGWICRKGAPKATQVAANRVKQRYKGRKGGNRSGEGRPSWSTAAPQIWIWSLYEYGAAGTRREQQGTFSPSKEGKLRALPTVSWRTVGYVRTPWVPFAAAKPLRLANG